MKIFFTFNVFILVLFVSCRNKSTTLQDNAYADEITVKTEEFILSTEDLPFLKDYNLISSHICDKKLDVIAAYNYKIHALDIFTIQDNYLAQIPLNSEGENAIIPDIQGLYFHSWDSIWIYNHGLVYLTDTTGIVKKKVDIGSLQNEEIIIQANYSISKVNLYYNKDRKSLFYATRLLQQDAYPHFYVYEYFLESGDVSKYELSHSEYDPDIMLMYGWKNSPNITFSDNNILYNYPIESNIYTINLFDKTKHIYGGKSKYTDNIVQRLTKNTELLDAEKHKIENIHFYEVIYNSKLNLYFRMHVDKNEFYPNEDAFMQFNKKNRYLMIFNSNFELIYEDKLPSDRYSIINSWCSVKEGLLMFVNNYFLDSTSEENTILFDVIKPQI